LQNIALALIRNPKKSTTTTIKLSRMINERDGKREKGGIWIVKIGIGKIKISPDGQKSGSNAN